jgi:hypothetical protein
MAQRTSCMHAIGNLLVSARVHRPGLMGVFWSVLEHFAVFASKIGSVFFGASPTSGLGKTKPKDKHPERDICD